MEMWDEKYSNKKKYIEKKIQNNKTKQAISNFKPPDAGKGAKPNKTKQTKSQQKKPSQK